MKYPTTELIIHKNEKYWILDYKRVGIRDVKPHHRSGSQATIFSIKKVTIVSWKIE